MCKDKAEIDAIPSKASHTGMLQSSKPMQYLHTPVNEDVTSLWREVRWYSVILLYTCKQNITRDKMLHCNNPCVLCII